jgi:hypothetical protein
MNNMVFREPTHAYRSDVSSHGLGGYNLLTGDAWRYRLPADILQIVTLNTLEFLGCIITLWIDIVAGVTPRESCILSQTDSTSAEGWLYKSNFPSSTHTIQLQAARHLATIIINADCCLYSQWIAGAANVVSDLLPRRFDLTNDLLASLILTTTPTQVPFGIRILPLPTEIDCWLTSLLHTARNLQQSQAKQQKRASEHGAVGRPTSPMWDSPTTLSSQSSVMPNVTAYPAPSRMPCAQDHSARLASIHSLLASSKPPSRMWHRPFGLTTGRTHDSTETEKWRSFYNAN